MCWIPKLMQSDDETKEDGDIEWRVDVAAHLRYRSREYKLEKYSVQPMLDF